MRKNKIIFFCVSVFLVYAMSYLLSYAMSAGPEPEGTEARQLSDNEKNAEAAMNKKAQETKKFQEEIEDEQEDRMIKDVRKDMLR